VAPPPVRDAAQRVADRAVDALYSNASIVQIVGGGGVLLSVLYTLTHGFFGWFPERALLESRQQVHSLEVELRDKRTEASEARAAWLQCLEGADHDGLG
jgi:hypothetical protein